MRVACNKHGLELVMLTTPTTPKDRMKTIANVSQQLRKDCCRSLVLMPALESLRHKLNPHRTPGARMLSCGDGSAGCVEDCMQFCRRSALCPSASHLMMCAWMTLQASQGFVYLVSVTGVTGVRTSMESRVGGLVDDLHAVSDKPVSAFALRYGVLGISRQQLTPELWGSSIGDL